MIVQGDITIHRYIFCDLLKRTSEMLGRGNQITYPKTLRPHHNKGPETPGWLSAVGALSEHLWLWLLRCVLLCWPRATLVGGFLANWARRIGVWLWLSGKLWKEKRKKKGKGLFSEDIWGLVSYFEIRGRESDHRPSNWWAPKWWDNVSCKPYFICNFRPLISKNSLYQ